MLQFDAQRRISRESHSAAGLRWLNVAMFVPMYIMLKCYFVYVHNHEKQTYKSIVFYC